MKKIIQLILAFIIIISLYLFYEIYFDKDNNDSSQKISPSDFKQKQIIENNKINKLEYRVNLNKEKKYVISSETSEIYNENNIEIVKMEKVKAVILDRNQELLVILSNYAEYNNLNYETIFKENISVKYMGHYIFSEKLNLNFKNNSIKISENVKYSSEYGTGTSDNIEIDLISKKVNIYMNNISDKVKVNFNQ